MSLDRNLADLRRHADDFARKVGFTYSVIQAPGDEVIGCVYIYPARDDSTIVEVHSWVRADQAHLDKPLYEAVSQWLITDWPFPHVRYAPRPPLGRARAISPEHPSFRLDQHDQPDAWLAAYPHGRTRRGRSGCAATSGAYR
jgi:hypothetical protein